MPPFGVDRPRRSTLQTLFVGSDPVLLLEYDPHRILAVIWPDSQQGTSFMLGRTPGEAENGAMIEPRSSLVWLPLFGIEEVWAALDTTVNNAGRVTVHAVYDN